jgi:hypothetical protein
VKDALREDPQTQRRLLGDIARNAGTPEGERAVARGFMRHIDGMMKDPLMAAYYSSNASECARLPGDIASDEELVARGHKIASIAGAHGNGEMLRLALREVVGAGVRVEALFTKVSDRAVCYAVGSPECLRAYVEAKFPLNLEWRSVTGRKTCLLDEVCRRTGNAKVFEMLVREGAVVRDYVIASALRLKRSEILSMTLSGRKAGARPRGARGEDMRYMCEMLLGKYRGAKKEHDDFLRYHLPWYLVTALRA